MPKPKIIVSSVELTEKDFPHLYRIAQNNPDGLAEQLAGMAKATGNNDLTSTAIFFELDLEHERWCI
jgi:hypothetical protein